jgi:hypothetical protein
MKIAKSAMIDEAKPAGFHLVKEFDFLPYQYFLVFLGIPGQGDSDFEVIPIKIPKLI